MSTTNGIMALIRKARLKDYIDRVQSSTDSPLLIGEFGYDSNHINATDALQELLQEEDYQHIGRIVWVWEANDNNDLTTDSASNGSGHKISSCYSKPDNLSALGELVWADTHRLIETDTSTTNLNSVPRQNYPFQQTIELTEFDSFNIASSDLSNGRLMLSDENAGDTQITAIDDSGILSADKYPGDLEVILEYADHALIKENAYQALLGLFLADDTYTWDSLATYPRITNKIYNSSGLNYSWFDLIDNAGQSWQAAETPTKNQWLPALVA